MEIKNKEHLQKTIQFFSRNIDFFRKAFSLYFSFTPELIKKYEAIITWKYISKNKNFNWTKALIEKYIDKIDFGRLSANESAEWTFPLLEKYEKRFHELGNNNAPSTEHTIIFNGETPWNYEGKEEFPFEFDRKRPPFNKENSSIENMDLPLTSFSRNKNLPWSVELLERFAYSLNWDALSSNEGLPWSTELIEKYFDRWDWSGLASNENLSWSTDLIEKYKDEWDWGSLSQNGSLPWSVDLIEKFFSRWDWDQITYNQKLFTLKDLVERYGIEDGFKNTPVGKYNNYTMKQLEAEKDELNWGEVCMNAALEWTPRMTETFEKYLVFGSERTVSSGIWKNDYGLSSNYGSTVNSVKIG